MVEGLRRYDEMSTLEEVRYVSSSEAVRPVLQFEIIKWLSAVVQLNVHFGNHHNVYFQENDKQSAAKRRKPGTKIIQWLAANEKRP